VFQAIAEDVVFRSEVACDFALPEPPNGGELRLDNVAVTQTSADGTVSAPFGQARTVNDCIPNAFYIENDRVYLCPDTCTGLRLDQGATVNVLFTCESNIIMAR
jgi:hypothetical protein